MYRQLVVLCKGADETITAIRTKPDGVTGKKVCIVNQVDHVAPGVSRYQNTLNFNITNEENLTVLKQSLRVTHLHCRQFAQAMKYLSILFAGQIAVFDFANIDSRVFEHQFAILFQGANMISILMSDQNILNRGCIKVQPGHFLPEMVIIVPCVNHDGFPVLGVEKDIGHPFPHTCHMVINPSRVQRLEDRFATKQSAHEFFLLFRILL